MLDPDIITGKLVGKTFVSKLYFFDEIGSTNDFAKISQLPDNSLIVTNFQIKGRGRFGREWESEKGKNLTFTIFKKLDIEPLEQININYCVSYSILNELKSFLKQFQINLSNLDLNIKWPNDIILNNKKIGGILIETKSDTKEFIIGAGINVNQENFTVSNYATSLCNELKKPVNLNNLLVKLVISLDKNLDFLTFRKYLELYELWKSNLNCINERVTYLASNGEKREGLVLDVLANGQILIRENGKNSTYSSGEIKLQF
ncbi:MAG TPA: biotin--[acetyl-CoA-carboxylase] ligase [Ignavibacteria bacterium]